jgi:hypothetical protein
MTSREQKIKIYDEEQKKLDGELHEIREYQRQGNNESRKINLGKNGTAILKKSSRLGNAFCEIAP